MPMSTSFRSAIRAPGQDPEPQRDAFERLVDRQAIERM